MPTLYYSPGACSLAPHLALEEAGADYELRRVDFSKTEQRSPEYLALNPKGRVPVFRDGDWVLTEAPAIMRYVARLYPAARLWPEDPKGDARCAEWLAWGSSGIHVSYAHTRRPERYADSDAAKQEVVEKAKGATRDILVQVEKKLGKETWAAGDRFSVADCYLLVFWMWAKGPALGFDVARDFPNWTAHALRMAGREAVQRTFEQEGLKLPA